MIKRFENLRDKVTESLIITNVISSHELTEDLSHTYTESLM